MSRSVDTRSLSHPRAVTSIKDPVHGSISLTSFEREVVDGEQFQRLHQILQNSTTYVAYPANKNSRFCHSLGVCHLSGTLFANALRNATKSDLEDFIEQIAQFFIHAQLMPGSYRSEDLVSAWKQTISGHSGFRHRPTLRYENGHPLESLSLRSEYPHDERRQDRKFRAGFVVDTIWQAIRICGLVHDIGHLPMSHSLEGAVEKFEPRFRKFIKQGTAPSKAKRKEIERTLDSAWDTLLGKAEYDSLFVELQGVLAAVYNAEQISEIRSLFASFPEHEKRSLLILYSLQENGIYGFTGHLAEYRKLIYRIAHLILLSSLSTEYSGGQEVPGPKNSAFRFLKLIIAGTIDADRMDYTVRDGMSCGSEIGQYSAVDILEAATLFRDKRDQRFKIGYFYRSLPEIENYFSQRHLGYKHLIYHRTSSRTETALQYATASIFEYCLAHPTDPITQYFARLGFVREKSGKLDAVFPVSLVGVDGINSDIPLLDDSKFRSFLDWTLEALKAKLPPSFDVGDGLEAQIVLLLQVVLRRKFEHVYDPFKDTSITPRAILALDRLCGAFTAEERNGQYKALLQLTLQERYELIRRAIVKHETLRNEVLKLAMSSLNDEIAGRALILTSTQKPKIYDHDFSQTKGEEIYLTYNGVREDEFVTVKPVIHPSVTLRAMSSIYEKEFRFNFYFISDNLKSNECLISAINDAMDNAFLSGLPPAIRHAAKSATEAARTLQERNEEDVPT